MVISPTLTDASADTELQMVPYTTKAARPFLCQISVNHYRLLFQELFELLTLFLFTFLFSLPYFQ